MTTTRETTGAPSGAAPLAVVDNRRMTAVTIAIAEPADSAEIDWAGVVASIVRTTFSAYDGDPGDTGVRVIDSWRADQ